MEQAQHIFPENAVSFFGPINGVHYVTGHALNRFCERARVRGTAGEVLRNLEGWMNRARPAYLADGVALKKLLNHQCRSAVYWLVGNTGKGQGWIVVVEGQTIKTIHKNASKEWKLPPA